MGLKNFIRDGMARALSMAGITAPGRRGAGRLSIATFHRVLPEAERRGYPHRGLVVTPQELDEFLGYFTAHFDCGTLAAQHERHLRKEDVARPLLAVTFDDAQHDNYRYARPVLARHGVKASFFVPVAAVAQQQLLWHDRLGFAVAGLLRQAGGEERLVRVLAARGMSVAGAPRLEALLRESKRLGVAERLRLVEALVEASGGEPAPDYARLMNFSEVAELGADGHEIGSHSMTHCMMTECDEGALAYEVAESRRVLQQSVAQPIESFCYPNGNSDRRSAGAVEAAGYRRAVTTRWGDNDLEADRFQLRRFDMDAAYVRDARGTILPALLALRMSGIYPGFG